MIPCILLNQVNGFLEFRRKIKFLLSFEINNIFHGKILDIDQEGLNSRFSAQTEAVLMTHNFFTTFFLSSYLPTFGIQFDSSSGIFKFKITLKSPGIISAPSSFLIPAPSLQTNHIGSNRTRIWKKATGQN